MKGFRFFVSTHAAYFLITGVWPWVDIESFMAVTGPKTDIWLVKTVGALLIPISMTMIAHLTSAGDTRPLFVLAGTTTIAFIGIDVYYSLNDTISDIYLADAAVEILFLSGWAYHRKYWFLRR